MAKETPWNPEHLEVVENGADAISKWRDDNPDRVLELSGADLGHHDLHRSNLSYAKLSHAKLGGANLGGADLQGAKLYCADLQRADLRDAILVRAHLYKGDFRRADLRSALLHETDLRLANLSDANLACSALYWSDLRGSNFVGANLSKARFGSTLIGTDVTAATGLEEAEHSAPSDITSRVLLRPTVKQWPLGFLRGIGLSDQEIAVIRGATQSAVGSEFKSVFISYSTKDNAFASKLYNALQERGVRCWRDMHEIKPGDRIHRSITDAIRSRDKVLVLCSKHSLKSDWVDEELTEALEKERATKRDMIIPVDLDGYVFSHHCKSQFTGKLKDRNAAKFKGWEDDEALFDAQLERVVCALTDQGR